MFTQLVESKPDRKRSKRGTILSFAAHYGLILVVIYTSAEASDVGKERRGEEVRFVEPPKPEAQPKQQPPDLVVAPVPSRTPPVFTAPIDIPTSIPEIDLTRAPTDLKMFESRRGPVGLPGGDSTATRALPADHMYLDFQVDKPVMQAPNSAAPAYPEMLRQAGVEGDALVSFVVDTLGRVELGTFKVIRTSHDLFASAVKNALPRMRFIPAETTGGKVRQLVQQPYSFSIVK
jgi:periplasmic protein TonB